jgi:cyclohexanone monooxygenase
MGIVGRDGQKLNDVWAAGPVSYLGLMTHGFPNLFTITGPGAAVALYNNPLAIEDHVDLATTVLQHMLDNGYETIEPDAQAQAAWREELNQRAAAEYRATCADVVDDDYRGFDFNRAAPSRTPPHSSRG